MAKNSCDRDYTIEEFVIASLNKSGIKIKKYNPENIEKIEINSLAGTRVKLKK